MRRAALATALAGVALLAATPGEHGTHDPTTGEYRACFEDEVVLWSGRDEGHTHCVPLDDLPRMLWQECVALAEGTDASYQECDERYGSGHTYNR